MRRSVSVTIAGQPYVLRSDADEAWVTRVAGVVDARFKKVQRDAREVSTHRVAMLAALQIADELLAERERRAALRRAVRARGKQVLELASALERAAVASNHLPSASVHIEIASSAAARTSSPVVSDRGRSEDEVL